MAHSSKRPLEGKYSTYIRKQCEFNFKPSLILWSRLNLPSANPHVITPDASRASTPVGNTETFHPSYPSVTPGNSILLPIGKVPGYLDATLKALMLLTEPRTSFITSVSIPLTLRTMNQSGVIFLDFFRYWLPDLLKHKYVALRFLPQESYEQLAPMVVPPTPQVVTRVFMLFRGVSSADLELWQSASALASTAAADDACDIIGAHCRCRCSTGIR
jgi:hypothetical protein